jgi:hypothetical protein
MIRRELKLDDGATIWLLVSQVEHAHVSGEVVRHWREEFSPDVVEAIAHHDDGWALWEESPKLNPKFGGPYSFLEMPIEESLVIWDNSIGAARKIGPLAGWIVAGHFYNLLADSEHANDPPAIAWLTAKRKVRTSWLDEWIRAEPSHTLEYAKRSQQMLLTADLFSLWLCCDCPVEAPSPRHGESRATCPLPEGEGKSARILRQSAMKLRTDALLTQFRFLLPECTILESVSKHRVEGFSWQVPVEPFPCKTAPIALTAQAVAAPVSKYASWQELAAASWLVELDWRLVPAV